MRETIASCLAMVAMADVMVLIDQVAASLARQLTPGEAAGSIFGIEIMRADHVVANGPFLLGVAFTVASLPLAIALAHDLRPALGKLLMFSTALGIGGAVSNGLSVLLFGAVSDFLVFRVSGVRAIAVPADIAILVGWLVGGLALIVVISSGRWACAACARSPALRATATKPILDGTTAPPIVGVHGSQPTDSVARS